MAEPLTKKIDTLPVMTAVAASNDKLLMLDVSESAVNMTKLVPMNLLSIHTSSQLAANTVGGSQIKDGAVTNSKLGADAVTSAKIADNAIGNEHIRDSAALSVIGRSSNTSGNPADIAAGTDGYVLRRSGTTLGFGTITTAGIADGAVTSDKLANNAVTESKLGTIKRTVVIKLNGSNDTVIAENNANLLAWAVTLNNFIVIDARINLATASSSGAVTVVLTNQGGTMATLSLAAGATGMSASGTIASSYRTAVTNNFLSANVTAAGTGAKGLSITLVLQGVPA